MRVSYIGITLASQASEAGSTPATRSSWEILYFIFFSARHCHVVDPDYSRYRLLPLVKYYTSCT